MLTANVGLSRKLSKDFNSTGFSLNLEGEINARLDDPEAVIERIRELYDLADEAIQRQIEAHQSDLAIASRDAEEPIEIGNGRSDGYANGHHMNGSGNGTLPARNGSQNGRSGGDAASNKQVQFLLTLAKREKIFGQKLEGLIEEITGRRCTPYELTKGEAGRVIDHLNAEGSKNDRGRY